MGETYVSVTVRNPREPERAWQGEFLVDTGAMDCVVPRAQAEAIGIEQQGRRIYWLADGSECEFDYGVAQFEFMDEVVGGCILFGDAGSEPLLGLTALESTGMVVDPKRNELRPGGRLRL